MRFIETAIEGPIIIELDEQADDRGSFARTFCAREFEGQGLSANIAQCNLSVTRKRGTLRGMHFQVAPAEEVKLVRCIHGAVYDVVIDLRPGSPTFARHIKVELSSENRRALYIPEMFAHGFQSLTDSSEVFYQMSEFYTPECARGVRYSDPLFNIDWPLPVTEIAARDASWPLLQTINSGSTNG